MSDRAPKRIPSTLILSVVWLAVLAGLTLSPQPQSLTEDLERISTCLVCGDRGTADALLNVALFVPFGLLTGSIGVAFSLMAAFVLSLGVELAQFFIPGRFSNFGDILWNAVGAALGIGLWKSRQSWLAFEGRDTSRLLRLAVAVAWCAPLASGWLLEPSFEPEPYWGQWTPQLGSMEVYRGRVLDAWVDEIPIPPGRFPSRAAPRQSLIGDWKMRATVAVGPPTTSLAPILNIYDGRRQEMTLLGALGEDLIWRERTRAKALRLDQPDLRRSGALTGLAAGDTVFLGVRRRGGDRCIFLEAWETCGLGFTPGRAWGLFLYPDGVSEQGRRLLDAGWMLILFVPVGFWSGSLRTLVGHALVGMTGVALAVAVTRLIPGPWTEWAGMGLGLWTGWRLRRFGLVRSAVSDRERA